MISAQHDAKTGSDIVQMLWVRNPVPWHAIASMQSFMNHGHDVHVYAYEDLTGLPDGITLLDGNEILPASSIFTYKDGWAAGHLSGFADWFRYELLHRKGGWWIDADVICLKALPRPPSFLFASEREADDPRSVTNNVIFTREPSQALFADAAAVCARKGADIRFAETGPELLRELVHRHGLTAQVAEPGTFNPIHYGDVRLLLDRPSVLFTKQMTRRLRGLRPVLLSRKTYGVHLYANLLRDMTGAGAEPTMPRSSFLAKLLADIDR